METRKPRPEVSGRGILAILSYDTEFLHQGLASGQEQVTKVPTLLLALTCQARGGQGAGSSGQESGWYGREHLPGLLWGVRLTDSSRYHAPNPWL